MWSGICLLVDVARAHSCALKRISSGEPDLSNLNNMLRHVALSLAAAAVLCASPLANADSLGTTGYVKGSQVFELSQGGDTKAGGFAGTWDASKIIFWCIELTEFFQFGGTYNDYTASEPNNPMFTMLGQLFTEAYQYATLDAQHSAAFQLAIWEIVYDADLNLGLGSLKVLSGDPDTVKLAQSWLDGLGNYTDNYHLIMLHSATHQDFVTFGTPFATRVPEPATLALLAMAVLSMGAVLRVRRSSAGSKRWLPRGQPSDR